MNKQNTTKKKKRKTQQQNNTKQTNMKKIVNFIYFKINIKIKY